MVVSVFCSIEIVKHLQIDCWEYTPFIGRDRPFERGLTEPVVKFSGNSLHDVKTWTDMITVTGSWKGEMKGKSGVGPFQIWELNLKKKRAQGDFSMSDNVRMLTYVVLYAQSAEEWTGY
ncbi:hypothetical protein HAX54_026473 [Datura stramonium]|uniref:Uncharacterized protein n=1 Tax=Datura stramonium TaxID=4076 RepID=A0ABS8V438_DATST|nr:hypothetical protein [Datura stramonium]